MKVCHLYMSGYSTVQTGVDNKIIGKCKEIEKILPGSIFVRVTPQKTTSAEDFFSTFKFELPNKRFFQNYYYNKAAFSAINELIKQDKGEYSFYLLRYPSASFSLLKLLKRNPNKIVFEHNTNERVELELRLNENKKKIPFSFRPSVIAYYLESIFFANLKENILGSMCLKHAAGGMVVTPEIGEIEKKIFNKYKTQVISNGIVPSPILPQPKRENLSVINGVFLAGTYAEWNGLERIINSYLKSNTQNKIHLYFVGRIDEKFKNEFSNLSHSVFFIDYLTKSELQVFLQKMHFAFGTCANQKRGLVEGAVLKVRECLAAGLPIVNGHSDPYIENTPELTKYYVNFPADESLLDFELIDQKIRTMYEENDVNTRIQILSNKHLAWSEVLKPLPDFLKNLKTAVN